MNSNTVILVAVVAAAGNLIQGWDNATMGGNIILDHHESLYKQI